METNRWIEFLKSYYFSLKNYDTKEQKLQITHAWEDLMYSNISFVVVPAM